MKRKYLSALLMGVLTLTSVSTFTSCKDYDDDISNLQEQIDKLATADQLSQKVAELQALISSNKSDITSLQSELAKKTTLDEVKAVLADYATKKYADDADATLKAALSGDIDALKAEIEKAQATANAAADDAKKANEEIQEMLTTLATKAEVAEVKTAAEAANAAIAALQTGDVATLKAKQAKILETLETVAKQAELDEVVKKAQALEEAVAKKADADALDKAEKELNAEIEKIKTTATEANKQAADNLVAIKGLDTTVKNASDALALAQANQTKLTEALESLKDSSKEGTVAATIKAIQAQLGTPSKELGTLEARLGVVESALNSVKGDDTKLDFAGWVKKIETKLADIIGEYTTMVTEVSLVGVNSANNVFNSNLDLKFESGKVVVKDFFFGKDQKDGSKDEENHDKFATDAENPVKYVKDTPFNNEKAIMVRVNPTNAQLTKDMIKLVNSKGEDLSNILEIGDPKAYGGLLTKAANQTGLWSIPVKVKAGVTSDKIEQKTKVNGAIKHIVYAVAIKNTATQKDAQDRYVTSTYDITLQEPSPFTPATDINDVKVWSEYTMGKGNKKDLGSLSRYADQGNAWYWDNVIPAKSGEKINIDFSELQDKIEYFYVVRDDNYTNYTQDTGSSEINAWNSYKYDGTAYKKLVKVEPNKTTGTLSVNINGVAGDDIAFRIFAVNRNGEVVPSTGRSFVVYVGEQQNNATVAGDITAIYDATDNTHTLYSASGWLKLNGTLKDGQPLPEDLTTTVDNKPVKFKVEYAKNANGDRASKNSEIQYAKFTCISDMLNWKDTEKAKGTIVKKDADGKMVENEISVTLTKVLPDVAYTKNHYGYTWKDGQVNDDGVYTAYVFPTNGWKRASTTGYKKLNQAITGLESGFNINIANIDKDDKNKYTVAKNITSTPWQVTVDEPLIDATTKHATKIGYNYGKISTEHKNARGQVIDWTINVEEVNTIFACPLDKSAQNYKWDKLSVTSGETTKYYEVNVLTYGSAATVVPNVFDYIIGKNSFDNNEFGGKLSTLIQTKYLSASAKLISNGSKKEDYYTVELERNTDNSLNGKVKFHSKSGNTNPVVDVPSTLVITLYDAFGHKMEYELPFMVKRAE